MITGNEPIVPMTYRQTGDDTSRVATPKDLNDNQHQHYLIFHEGLTIRQHFAAMAMQGLLSNMKNGYDKKAAVSYAEDAVYLADALISELNKTDQS